MFLRVTGPGRGCVCRCEASSGGNDRTQHISAHVLSIKYQQRVFFVFLEENSRFVLSFLVLFGLLLYVRQLIVVCGGWSSGALNRTYVLDVYCWNPLHRMFCPLFCSPLLFDCKTMTCIKLRSMLEEKGKNLQSGKSIVFLTKKQTKIQ